MTDCFPIGIRVPDAHRAALEHAAAARGLSTAGFVEWCVSRALADAGLIEQPNPEEP
jgi:uncharacterized protein (DUF1778 family)